MGYQKWMLMFLWLQNVPVPLSPTIKQTHSPASPLSAGKRLSGEHSRPHTHTHTHTTPWSQGQYELARSISMTDIVQGDQTWVFVYFVLWYLFTLGCMSRSSVVSDGLGRTSLKWPAVVSNSAENVNWVNQSVIHAQVHICAHQSSDHFTTEPDLAGCPLDLLVYKYKQIQWDSEDLIS